MAKRKLKKASAESANWKPICPGCLTEFAPIHGERTACYCVECQLCSSCIDTQAILPPWFNTDAGAGTGVGHGPLVPILRFDVL